jgi:hypothetical protein
MKALAFFTTIVLAMSAAWAEDKASASRGSSVEKSRTAGGVSADMIKEFESLDANKDGFLTKEELQSKPKLVAEFAKADKDRDGKLDPAEYQVLNAEASSKGGE